MMVNGESDTQILRDIEDMYAAVQLEASLLQMDYVPKGERDKRKEVENFLIAFKAERYREWIKSKAAYYQDAHPFLHFQFARILALGEDKLVVEVMSELRKSFNSVSLQQRCQYVEEARKEVNDRLFWQMSRKTG